MFKLLVVGNQIILLAYTLLDEMTTNALTAGESVFAIQNSNWPPLSDVPYWLGWILLLTGLMGAVGLCLEQRWGRTLFLATFAAAVISTPLTELYVSSGWASLFGYLSGATEGMIIALAYFSPVKRMLEPSEPDSLD
ncbi:MAG TPA: hypothetical protein VFX97_13565 [Pyrinomonadaceae bacterium]|nr:hypothetical protein [Pyrinomonadaceae bacterium]